MACFGTGIGVAVYDYDNRLYRAGHKYHPELGHMVIDSMVGAADTSCYADKEAVLKVSGPKRH